MNENRSPIGALLVNLGTPDSPNVRDVRRYLREFLSDPDVITLPGPLRWLLVNAVILPTRPRRSAHAYQQIWLPEGSPLMVHSRALCDAVAEKLRPGIHVELAMRYGTPSIPSALEKLAAAQIGRLIVLPMFPQYCQATTGSIVARIGECLAPAGLSHIEPDTIQDFFAEPGFIEALAAPARGVLESFRPDHVLFSYHGLPESHIRDAATPGWKCLDIDDCCDAMLPANRGCYRAQCYATGRALQHALELPDDRCSSAFQSRLGRSPWIRPYTDEVVVELAERGVKRLAVLCPAFTADCLETLEEIGIRLRQQWLALGGEALELCPCPNAAPGWVDAVCEILRRTADESARASVPRV